MKGLAIAIFGALFCVTVRMSHILQNYSIDSFLASIYHQIVFIPNDFRQVIIGAPSAKFADESRGRDIVKDIKRFKCIVSTIRKTVKGTWFEKEWPDFEGKFNNAIKELESCAQLDDNVDQQM